MVTGSDVAHLAVPIDITYLQEQLRMVHKIASQLLTITSVLGPQTKGGLYVQTLSHTADITYENLNNKYNTIVFFYTRTLHYDSDKVFKLLEDRRKPIEKLIPDPTRSPRTNLLKDSYLSHHLLNTQRSIETPDDVQANQDDSEEDAEVEGSGETDNTTAVEQEEEAVPDTTLKPTIATSSGNSSGPYLNEDGTFQFKAMYNREAQNPENFDNPFSNNITEPIPDPDDRKKRSALRDTSQAVKGRPKRFVFSLVLSLLASVGVSSIFGAVTASKMSTLSSEVSDLSEKQNLIVHQIEQGSKAILANRNRINNLAALSTKLAKYFTAAHFEADGVLLYIVMTAEFARIDEALDVFVQIVEAATNHQFHPAILSQHGGVAAFEEIKAKAESRNLFPVINNAQQMSQMNTHFFYTPTGINLVIEIPLCGEHNTFVLYQFQALPIQLTPEAFLTLEPKNPLLGIGETDLNTHSKYVELTHPELSKCRRFGQVFLCKEQTIVNRPNSDSCLYALYISDHLAAKMNCHVNIKSNARDHAVSVGHNSYSYYSAKPSLYNVICQNGSLSSSGHQLSGISKLKVPQSCRIETSRFVLYPESEWFQETHPKRFKWTLPSLSFLENDTTITDINTAVEAVENAKGAPDLDPDFIKEFKRRSLPFYHDKFPFSAFVLASVGMLIILTLISIVVFKNYVAQRKARNENDPGYRWSRLLKSEAEFEEHIQNLITRRTST
jgi:hypothetical protein